MVNLRFVLFLMFLVSVMLVGCSSDKTDHQEINKLIDEDRIDDGCYETFFVFNQELGICEKKGRDGGSCDETPIIDKLLDCEETNTIRIPEIDIRDFCQNQVNKINPTTYQYESLIQSVKNNCLHNFAIAQRENDLCNGITRESHKEICLDDVKQFRG